MLLEVKTIYLQEMFFTKLDLVLKYFFFKATSRRMAISQSHHMHSLLVEKIKRDDVPIALGMDYIIN